MSYPYSYHLLPFETYKEWFDADMKSLIHNVHGLQNNLLWLKLCYATPYLDREHALDYFSIDCILQANNIRHKTHLPYCAETSYPPSCGSPETFPPIMTQPNSPTFETVLSIPHYNLSAHTFAVHTLPLHHISAIVDFLTSNPAATWDLLVLDQINRTIVNLEQQLDKQHHLAAQCFSLLLTHQSTSQILQHIHDIKQPDCQHW